MVYFEGGGACFDVFNCAANPSSISEDRQHPAPAGLFDRGNEDNPVGDWDYLYLPYCSGDVFSGTLNDVHLPEMEGEQQFVGDKNMQLFLNRIVPTLGGSYDKVLVTGVSAGGISALANTQRMARAFPKADIIALDDGGPPLSTKVVPECLQELWRELWGLESSVLADCGADCPNENDYLVDMAQSIAEKHTLGLFSFESDGTVRLLFSFGLNDCALSPLPYMKAEVLTRGLYEFRELLEGDSYRFASYYTPGEAKHTCIQHGCFYNETRDGVTVAEWVGKLINGELMHVGTAPETLDE